MTTRPPSRQVPDNMSRRTVTRTTTAHGIPDHHHRNGPLPPPPSSFRQHNWLSQPVLQECYNSISNQRGGVITRRVTVLLSSPAGPRCSPRYSEDQRARSTATQHGNGTGGPSIKSVSQEHHQQRRLPHTSNVIRGNFARRRRRRVTGPRPTDRETRRDHLLRANR
ncbi:hypothetical protein MRX96_031918 [Rhipicephalus microplus]